MSNIVDVLKYTGYKGQVSGDIQMYIMRIIYYIYESLLKILWDNCPRTRSYRKGRRNIGGRAAAAEEQRGKQEAWKGRWRRCMGGALEEE